MLRRTAASLVLLTSMACSSKASGDETGSGTESATSEAGSDAEESTGGETGPVENCGLVGSNSQLMGDQCVCDPGFDWCAPNDPENFLCCDPSTTSGTSGDGDGDSTSGDGDGDGDSTSGDGDGDGDGDSTSGDGDGDGDSTSGDGDGDGCQLSDVISESDWDAMFLHKDDQACSGTGYTFPGFIAAASDYPAFACDGDLQVRRREVAAFLAQISHETTGGWATAPDGAHSWGLCFIEEVGCDSGGCTQYCDAGNSTYPCASGKTYHGRGAIQLSWNYNYGQAGDALGVDLLANPEMVANDPELAIQTALWFWMTEQLPKPSAHDVMVGNWTPSASDTAAGRVPGFGMTTNIINGGLECGFSTPAAVEDRVGFFNRYAPMLSTTVGDNLYCDAMSSF